MVKKTLLLTAGIVLATTVYASDKRGSTYMINTKGEKTFWSANGQKLNTVIDATKSLRKPNVDIVGQGEPKVLDIEIKYDKDIYQFEHIVGGIEDFTDFGSWEPLSGLVEVPSGINALMCIWRKFNEDLSEDYFVVAKDISYLKNNSKLVFDVADCVHKVSYYPLGPDGKLIDIEKKHYDGSIETAALTHGFAMTSLNHKDAPLMWHIASFYGIQVAEDGTIFHDGWLNAVWFNDCGPTFNMTHHIIGMPSDGKNFHAIEMPVYIGESSTRASETVLKNNPNNYKEYVREWIRSPYSTAQYDKLLFNTRIGVVQSGVSFWSIGGEIQEYVPQYVDSPLITTYLMVCANDEDDPNRDIASMILMDILPESDSESNCVQSSMWWRPSKDGRKFLTINHSGAQALIGGAYQTPVNFVEDNYNQWLLSLGKPNPYLILNDSNITGQMGNNTPIISLMPGDYHKFFNSDFMPFYTGLVGRFGESNTCGSQYLVEENNSYIYDDNNIRKDIFTYDNILIDDKIDGCVTVELGIKKGEGMATDFVPPVITFLGMHDAAGSLTDRFETAAHGTIEFYAGDFFLDYNWSLGEFDVPVYQCKPTSSVKVEYAPYQTDNFAELTVTEVPEKYFYPGWGNYYTVPLKDVSAKSANAWFDLRISLEDEAGNTHVQTLSPAFRINDASGVETVYSDSGSCESVYYDMMGRRVDNPANGIFIERRGNVSRKVMK